MPLHALQAAGLISANIDIVKAAVLGFVEGLTEQFRPAKIYFKREELNHPGPHKINNRMGHITKIGRASWRERV